MVGDEDRMVATVASADEFRDAVRGAREQVVAAYFSAPEHPACTPGGQMDAILDLLCKQNHNVTILKADAKELSQVASALGVTVVPTVVILLGGVGEAISKVQGADPVALQNALNSAVLMLAETKPQAKSTEDSSKGCCSPKKMETSSAATVEECSSKGCCSSPQTQVKAPPADYPSDCSNKDSCSSSQTQIKAPSAASLGDCSSKGCCSSSKAQIKAAPAESLGDCSSKGCCSSSQAQTKAPSAASPDGCSSKGCCSSSQTQIKAVPAESRGDCSSKDSCSSSQTQIKGPSAASPDDCSNKGCCSSSQTQIKAVPAESLGDCSSKGSCSSSQMQMKGPSAASPDDCSNKGCCSSSQTQIKAVVPAESLGDCSSKGCCSSSQTQIKGPSAASPDDCSSKGPEKASDDCCSEPSHCDDECCEEPHTDVISVLSLCCEEKASSIQEDLSSLHGFRNFIPDFVERKLFVTHQCHQSPCDKVVDTLNSGQRQYHASLLKHEQPGYGTIGGSALARSLIKVEGMCCAMEAQMLHTILGHRKGVKDVAPNAVLKRVSVLHEQQVSAEQLVDWINNENLQAKLMKDGFASMQRKSSQSRDEFVLQMTEGTSLLGETGVNEKETLSNLSGSQWPSWNVLVALPCWLASLGHYWHGHENVKLFALVSVILCLPPILYKGLTRLFKLGALDVNMLMALAVVGAVGIGDYSEAAAVVTIFSLSDWLESRATRQVRSAMNELFSLSPEQAILASDGSVVPVDNVAIGTRLAVRGGEKFPVDAIVVHGSTFADESALTGESRPVSKPLNAPVAGGSVNVGDYVEVVSTASHSDSAVSKVIKLVEEANMARAPTEQLVERVARFYTPTVFSLAILFASVPWAWGKDVGLHYLNVALVMLVVACPCALVISTPMTYVCGLTNAAKKGILIKGGAHLETLAKVDHLACDKTGTLTLGDFTLRQFKTLKGLHESNLTELQLLTMVYAAQKGSPHPLATAFCHYIKNRFPDRDEFKSQTELAILLNVETIKGQGIKAEVLFSRTNCSNAKEPCTTRTYTLLIGNNRLAKAHGWDAHAGQAQVGLIQEWEQQAGFTAGWVGLQDVGPLALFAAGDQIRPESKQVVAELQNMNISTTLLTGDNVGAAKIVARQLGIGSYFAALLPQDKVKHVLDTPGVVAMIGDGVNDAPSLAAANVSFSLGCIGSAAALETADVALMQDNLEKLLQAILLGRLCYRKIVQNVVFAIVLKVAILFITFTFYESLWLAIFADVGGMLAVTLNSMTILNDPLNRETS